MEVKCTDCMVTFEAPYDKDCPFCGTDAFVVEITNNTEKIEKKLATAIGALKEIRVGGDEVIIDPVFLFHQSQTIVAKALNELGENDEI